MDRSTGYPRHLEAESRVVALVPTEVTLREVVLRPDERRDAGECDGERGVVDSEREADAIAVHAVVHEGKRGGGEG